MSTLIIGAGPAGLATAGRMRKMGLDFEMIEQTDKIAWSWTNHYDRLLLHTVKQFSHLPHMEFPADYPLYVPRLKLVEYYNNYAKHFDIQPHFNTSANSVKKSGNKWVVATSSGKSFEVDNVVIATGVNRVPQRPQWEGEATYKGQIVHSRNYKNVEPFRGKKVLVVGMGNTGAELALDLAENGIETYISVRSPITMVPRDVNGRPVQVTAKQLAKLPFGFGDWLGTQIRRLVIGDLTKYNIPMSDVHPAVQLRETGKTPVIDLGTVKYIKAGKIKAIGDISHFHENGVVETNGTSHDFDSVILATGYQPKLANFIENVDVLLDKYGCPKSPKAEGEHKGLYFVGFDNYKLGGLLGTIFTDSEVIANDIKASR
jgi:cation diffusion facilitator CzcD-associated flavoprotein CzcO